MEISKMVDDELSKKITAELEIANKKNRRNHC